MPSIHLLPIIVMLFLASSCSNISSEVIEFREGVWFDGQSFAETTFYSVDGILLNSYSGSVDSVIDLEKGFVIPPFGDAHTHNLADTSTFDEMAQEYLRDGIFYVQVLTNYASNADSLKSKLSDLESIDIRYANGGLTATLGHPFVAYETSALGLHWSAMFSQRDRIKESRLAENDAYWFLDTVEDVEHKWGSILASGPDLIKIYLINTGQHRELVEKEQMGNFGLSEEVARVIVEKAREAGLRVYAHVETAYDFRVGLDIGVDGFGHLPGYSWDGKEDVEKYRLTDKDLQKAEEQGVVIIPTANFTKVYATRYDNQGNSTLDEERLKTVNQFLKEELKRVYKKGIPVRF